jgi:integrase
MPATGDRITKRKDGLFQGMYTAHTPGGPRRKYIYGRRKKDVERRLAEAMGDAARGVVFDAKGVTVGEWLDAWLTDTIKPLVDAGKLTYSTYKRYAGIVRKHLKPALGHRKLRDVTRAEVRKLYAAKAATLSPRSVDYIHITLQKALSQAVRDDLIPRNVAAGERPHSTRHTSPDRVKALSPAQVRALLEAAQGTRNEALYILALHTGLRQGELLGLRWADIDLEAGKLSVRRSLKIAVHGLDFGPPKNKASRRSVPLNKSATAALRAHKARQNAERIAAGEWRDAQLVFASRVGGPIDPTNLYNREYKPLLERAGLAGHGFTFHALRHTFATALFSRGEHPKRVQSLLGHASITQTMDTYSHLIDDIGGDAVDGLDDAFRL